MSERYLLDANALIALAIVEHEHHERAARWSLGAAEILLCPVVEGALCRFLGRSGVRGNDARELLQAFYGEPRISFCHDSISYCDADLDHVVGHRQMTDAYLASLAEETGSRLATFDKALVGARPDVATMIP